MKVVYVDNKKSVSTNIASVVDGVATVEFTVDGELALTRPISIPDIANGNTQHESFTTIVNSYARRLRFNAHVGLKQDETVQAP